MFIREYPQADGYKVWLDSEEVDLFLDQALDQEQKIAFLLMLRSGLRSSEVLNVRPKDVVETEAGPRVYVYDGKGGKDRQTIATAELLSISETVVDYGGCEPDEPFVETNHTRTIRRWVDRAASRLQEATGDPGWEYLSPHDLRGTWATELAQTHDVDPILVCEWGGWEDLETFLEHYRGAYSPDVQRRELSKVPWMNISTDAKATSGVEAVGRPTGASIR